MDNPSLFFVIPLLIFIISYVFEGKKGEKKTKNRAKSGEKWGKNP